MVSKYAKSLKIVVWGGRQNISGVNFRQETFNFKGL